MEPERLTLRIVPLQPDHAKALGEFFESIRGDKTWFHPHELTVETALELADHANTSKDVYVVAMIESVVVAYGLLRGWEEGFEIPSLGIAVHPDYRGKSLGRAVMECLHSIAKLRDAPAVRLKVHPKNTKARLLYIALGYLWEAKREDGQVVGVLKLTSGSPP